ncbi:Gfo/Idh/MocA family protein [Deinococcus altitudinis]|uniref:Gfo/Idh/MocA family protein n=1 Tax=Deinococcus altitudinis TaxID=468914 RepID=UPI003891EED2
MKVAVLGCGNRGGVYARHLTDMGASVSHLADPDPARLALVARRHGLESTDCFTDWRAFFGLGRVADAVVIATPDDQHVQPCLRALDLGYHVLLEKPICLAEAELDLLLAAERASGGSVTVAHVLRSTPFFLAIRGVVASGELGRLVGVNHSENVAFWHFAHSYVRGNWRQSPPAAPFMLAKSSHDLDLLRWFADSPPAWIMADGALHHFRPEEQPGGAADRCLDCPVQACPADARRIYPDRAPDVWPNTVLTGSGTREGVLEALRNGPYGLCAYRGGNDQPDHLSALIHFANGVQATLSVSAFTHDNTRTLRLMFTGGEIRGQMELGELEVHHFATGTVERRLVETGGNHGGGDTGLVRGWLAFLRGEAARPTPLAESLDSHRLAFAAERARSSGRAQTLNTEATTHMTQP